MSKDSHTVTFWGVRGSIATDDPDKTHFGGNTSCVEVNAHDGSHIIFDSGTGIRSLGNRIADEHDSEYEINLFLSHTHWDHILGFPFFDEPGTYRYYCSIHPTLQRGVIIVSPDGLVGDVNCDGEVNAIDSVLILQLVAGMLDELACSENSDTNADGSTDAIDAALVLQLSAGLLGELPP